MRGKTNVYQRTERLLISFSIKTKEGFDLRKKIRATLDEENILFSSDESKSTTIFKFESMYIKIYCDQYLPGKLEISLFENTKFNINVIMLILKNSKEFLIEDKTNGLNFFTNLRKRITSSKLYDMISNNNSSTITSEEKVNKFMGLENIYRYQLLGALRSNKSVLLTYIYSNSIILKKSSISIVGLLIPYMFDQNKNIKCKIIGDDFNLYKKVNKN